MNAIDSLVEYIERFTLRELSVEVQHQVDRCLVDYLACLYAGSAQSAYKDALTKTAVSNSDGSARVFGTDKKTAPEMAALFNAISSHTVELDDGHRQAMAHIGSPVFSALFAAWDSERVDDFKCFAMGAVCGYQITVILANSLQPSHKKKGFHGTGTCGAIGAAVAIAVMLGYNRDQIKSTISLAATSASGLLEMIDNGSQMKPYNVGHAALVGYIAALLGGCAPVPPHDALGGKRGFLEVLAGPDGYRPLVMPDDTYLIMDIYTKPYAACRHCHPPIEAAEQLAKNYQLAPEDISHINVKTYDLAVFGHDVTSGFNVSSAKMSTPFCVASMFCGNGAGFSAFNDRTVSRKDICALAQRVSVLEDDEMTAQLPNKRGCIMEVIRVDGGVLTCKVDYPKGEPENPMSDGELEDKFKELVSASGFYGEQETKNLVVSLWKGNKKAALDNLR